MIMQSGILDELQERAQTDMEANNFLCIHCGSKYPIIANPKLSIHDNLIVMERSAFIQAAMRNCPAPIRLTGKNIHRGAAASGSFTKSRNTPTKVVTVPCT